MIHSGKYRCNAAGMILLSGANDRQTKNNSLSLRSRNSANTLVVTFTAAAAAMVDNIRIRSNMSVSNPQ